LWIVDSKLNHSARGRLVIMFGFVVEICSVREGWQQLTPPLGEYYLLLVLGIQCVSYHYYTLSLTRPQADL